MPSFRVTFVLPHATNVPIGGYKAVYEFANGLVERGHQVSIVLPWNMDPMPGIVNEIKSAVRPVIYRLRKPIEITWFPIDPRVRLIICSDLREKWIPPSDFVVATSWATAPFVAGYSPRLGKKLYLIQHLETFGGPYDDVVATWKLPLQKLTIARWLAEFAETLGEASIPIRVGVELREFDLDQPIAGRGPTVAMMFAESAIKGSGDGIKALEMVKAQVPDLKAILFGISERPSIPDWMTYERRVPAERLRAIYNQASVFLHPSLSEGWPAPPAEAMACGTAVVAAANPGIMDYAKSGVTAFTSEPGNWTELAENLLKLLKDEPLRCRIAEAGNADIQHYSWQHAQQRFAEVLDQLTKA